MSDKPKYEVGDRLPGSNAYVKDIQGDQYLLEVNDQTIFVDCKYLDVPVSILVLKKLKR